VLFTHSFSIFSHPPASGRHSVLVRRAAGQRHVEGGGANKKAPTQDEKGLQNGCALLIFPKLMMLELELAPGIEI